MKCTGSPGHGSRFITNTAAEKLVREWGQWGALRGPGVGALHGGHWACGWELLTGGMGRGAAWGMVPPVQVVLGCLHQVFASPAQSDHLLPGLQGEREAEVGHGWRGCVGLTVVLGGALFSLGIQGVPSEALTQHCIPMPQFTCMGVGARSTSPPLGAEGDCPLHPPRLKSNTSLTLGDVTSLNMTMLEGGVSFNVVPSEMAVGFDIRIPPTVDLKVGTVLAPCGGSGLGVPLLTPSCAACPRPSRSRWLRGAGRLGMVSRMSFTR